MQTLTDTTPEIAEMARARLMARTGSEQFRMGVEMSKVARRMVLASLPADPPKSQRKRQLFARIYGEALPRQARFQD